MKWDIFSRFRVRYAPDASAPRRAGTTGPGSNTVARRRRRRVSPKPRRQDFARPPMPTLALGGRPPALPAASLPAGRRFLRCRRPSAPSSRGLGHCPFTAATRVRLPLGSRSSDAPADPSGRCFVSRRRRRTHAPAPARAATPPKRSSNATSAAPVKPSGVAAFAHAPDAASCAATIRQMPPSVSASLVRSNKSMRSGPTSRYSSPRSSSARLHTRSGIATPSGSSMRSRSRPSRESPVLAGSPHHRSMTL